PAREGPAGEALARGGPSGRDPAAHRPRLVEADMVESAARRLQGVVEVTPLKQNRRLSMRYGAHVLVKREDQQTVRSYKVRGAYNLISQLGDEARASGVVAASAGNHAQGVARACSALGVRGRVYLPSRTPKQKRDQIGRATCRDR